MAFASPPSAHRPLSEINTTPLIDVLLVLLVMLVITIPVATHSVNIDVPRGEGPVHPMSNDLTLSADGTLRWNGTTIEDSQLAGLLAQTNAMPVIPELRFKPDAAVRYDRAAKVLRTIKQSGITGFGFVGNERFATFGGAN